MLRLKIDVLLRRTMRCNVLARRSAAATSSAHKQAALLQHMIVPKPLLTPHNRSFVCARQPPAVRQKVAHCSSAEVQVQHTTPAAASLLDDLYGSDDTPAAASDAPTAPGQQPQAGKAAARPLDTKQQQPRQQQQQQQGQAQQQRQPRQPDQQRPQQGKQQQRRRARSPSFWPAPAGGARGPPTPVAASGGLPEDLGVFYNAMVLVDKPQEWSSFDACSKLKAALQKALGPNCKVGHAGTLDPMATGLLVICTGSGTKAIDSFQGMDKEYSGKVRLGQGTASLDAETDVEEELPWEHITDEQLQEAAQKLTGDIQQVPPMYSAIHHKGQRLYDLARAGETVERAAREVNVSRFDVSRQEQGSQDVHFYVRCSKGTYIRTLAHDLATSLGTTGHLVALRREAIGVYNVKDAWEPAQLADAIYARVNAAKAAAQQAANGASAATPGADADQ